MASVQQVHVAEVVSRPGFLTRWERTRHRDARVLVQCVAEGTGVFLYCFFGVGSQAVYTIGNLTNSPGLGSLLQIGFGYLVGIVLALTICLPTSGGHFNPCFTIASMVFKGFPVRKGILFIIAQIIGAYIALLVIYLQYRGLILEVSAAIEAAQAGALDAINFTPDGPAGIFGIYVQPGSNLGSVFWNEFICDFVLALTVWAVMDVSNPFAPPAAIPLLVGLAYGAAVFGYAPVGLAMNSARDIGGRLMVLTIWGTKAAGGPYAAIAALTNIPASLLGALFYEVFLSDSARVILSAHHEVILAHEAYEVRRNEGASVVDLSSPSSQTDEEKGSQR